MVNKLFLILCLLITCKSASSEEVSRFNKIYVMGEVNKQQSIDWYEDIRIMDAIIECGGITRIRVKTDRVYLWRNDVRYTIDIKSFFKGDPEQNVQLQKGDIIILERNLFAKASDTLRTILSPFTDIFSGLSGYATTAALNN